MQRRQFLAAATIAAAQSSQIGASLFGADDTVNERVPLGLDGHSMRGMRWKATPLIEFAAEQRLDAVLFNGLHYFESLEASHLRKSS